MRRTATTAILALAAIAATLSASADKLKGPATLKDLQPFGTTDKQHKHQAYDLSFDAEGHSYTCRTNSKKSTDATEFVVGSQINYEIDKNKAKIKTRQNKKLECKIVRVEKSPAP
ncbi:hypothetical protein [Edaphobacter bradus]|uniref:hypothetical protein n=1 Tax=Edaphobacter bradus TaxID=2259016 RepID=UPI0021E0A556|nr:hypothetical protein [Edaphobacter bradus]